MTKLPTITYHGTKHYVDFRLGELRSVKTAHVIRFTQLPEDKYSPLKKKLRAIRFRHWQNEYIAGIDD